MIIFTMVAAACSAPTPPPTPTPEPPTSTPIPPTLTPTPRPTSTPTEVFTLAGSADEVLGTWSNPSISTHRFNKNGTLNYSHSPDTIDTPFAVNEFWFEGKKLFIKEISVSGVTPCGKVAVGSYEVRLLASGNMQLRAIEDKCKLRKESTQGIYEPVR